MNEEHEVDTIGMLLDIEHLHGEHEGRLAPVLMTISIICIPILLYIYFGAFSIIPLWLFIPFEILLAIRTIMIIQGRERHRVKLYKNRLNSDYTNTAHMLNVKTIHPDGCVEFVNGTVKYLVCCYNGTSDDEVRRSVQLRKFLEAMLVDFDFDIHILNINDSKALREYYDKVSNFDKNISAKNFINIIDHSLNLTEDTSVVQCTVYVARCSKHSWKTLKTQIDAALDSSTARCYKKVYRVNDPIAINDILNRDVDSVINMSDLTRKKYATHQYDTSKVLAYDLPEDKEIVQGKANQNPVIVDKPPIGSFHVIYKDEGNN